MAARRTPLRQRGAALLIFVLLIALSAAALLMRGPLGEEIERRRQQQTAAALAAARDALLGYVLKFRDEQESHGQPGRVYGYLPLPDLGTSRNNNVACRLVPSDPASEQEGCEANTPSGINPSSYNDTYPTLVGRLPWRTLGIAPLRDGYGECLWLIVAAPHLSANAAKPNSPVMNWDTLGQFDIRIASGGTLASAIGLGLTGAGAEHDRPVAVIFAPGPPLPGQDRSPHNNGDDVTQCGGNYDARNYLDPVVAADLGGLSNYLGGANNASGATGDTNRDNDPDAPKALTTHGRLAKQGSAIVANTCRDCREIANDIGLSITNAMIFSTLRNQGGFRSNLSDLLAASGECLEAVGAFTPLAIGGTHASGRYGRAPAAANCKDWPQGYFTHYAEQLFAARVEDINACKTSPATPGNCFEVNVAGGPLEPATQKKCHGVVLLGGERLETSGGGTRRIEQPRVTAAQRNDIANYLEGANRDSFASGGLVFGGTARFEKPRPGLLPSQDVVRCLPASGYSAENPDGAALVAVQNAALGDATQQLARFDAASGILTLGQAYTTTPAGGAAPLFGCAWETEVLPLGGGLRHYFRFRINDAGFTSSSFDGFLFAVVDADSNGPLACGAARQHLGYSGNNGITPILAAPKIGVELDARRNYRANAAFDAPTGFDPAYLGSTPVTDSHLNNGRADPSYNGGHTALVYWGGDQPIRTGIACGSGCTYPQYCGSDSICYLRPEEDDNVHGRALSGCHAPPGNPAAPPTPTPSAGVYKLDPNLSSVPVNQDFHVRVELTRTAPAGITLPAVRVAAPAPLDRALPGAVIDGVALRPGDRVLLWRQASAAENGVYVWNAADQPLSRASDFDSNGELAGAIVIVAEGTAYARTSWRQSNASAQPESSAILWQQVAVRLATASWPIPATIDGFALNAGDRVLVTTGANAGVWIWQGGSTSRPADIQTLSPGLAVRIAQGTYAHRWWRYDGAAWSEAPSVRFAAQANVDLTTTTAPTDDCLNAASGDRILLRHQTNLAENGIYVWSGSALGRAGDADSAAELAGAIVQVRDGTDFGRAFRLDGLAVDGVLGTDRIAWTPLDPLFAPDYTLEVWLLPDSPTDAQRIAAMKDTSRPMRQFDATFAPHLRDQPRIYHPFRNARLGMTIGQRAAINDQTVTVYERRTTRLD